MDKIDELVEWVAGRNFERGLSTLADFYEGLENIPAELLDKQWNFEVDFAKQILSHPDLYQKVKCPHCSWSQFQNDEAVGMTPCHECHGVGIFFRGEPVEEICQICKGTGIALIGRNERPE